MNIESVTERDALPGRNGQGPCPLVLYPKIRKSKGIGREKPVIADMPRRWMARIARMIENGQTDGLAAHWSIVIAPISVFAPRCVIRNARALHNLTFASL